MTVGLGGVCDPSLRLDLLTEVNAADRGVETFIFPFRNQEYDNTQDISD